MALLVLDAIISCRAGSSWISVIAASEGTDAVTKGDRCSDKGEV